MAKKQLRIYIQAKKNLYIVKMLHLFEAFKKKHLMKQNILKNCIITEAETVKSKTIKSEIYNLNLDLLNQNIPNLLKYTQQNTLDE